jgi:hypothetical protein
MNFMSRKKYSMAAGVTNYDIVASSDISICGWIGVAQFVFNSAASGDVSLKLKQNGETSWSTLAIDTPSTKGEIIWTGNQVIRDGDTLRIVNETGTAVTVFLTFVYEPWGAGSWQEFTFGAGEASSSSSSSSSSLSSESSKSSSSEQYSQSSASSNSSSSVSSDSSLSSSSLSSESSSSLSSESSASSASISSASSESLSSESSENYSDSSESSSQSSGLIGPCEEFYTASTFGTTLINGVYNVEGRHNNRAYYKHATRSYYIFWSSGLSVWAIAATLGAAPANWLSNSSGSTTCPPGAFTDEDGLVT